MHSEVVAENRIAGRIFLASQPSPTPSQVCFYFKSNGRRKEFFVSQNLRIISLFFILD
jgi:hypothetical protein